MEKMVDEAHLPHCKVNHGSSGFQELDPDRDLVLGR